MRLFKAEALLRGREEGEAEGHNTTLTYASKRMKGALDLFSSLVEQMGIFALSTLRGYTIRRHSGEAHYTMMYVAPGCL